MVSGLLLALDLATLTLGILILHPSKPDTVYYVFWYILISVELLCMLPTFFTSHEILEILMCFESSKQR